MQYTVSPSQLVTRVVKYLVEGVVLMFVASFMMPKLHLMEVLVLGLTAAATFSLLDFVSPSISMSARQGSGLGIGLKMVGFP